MKTGRAPIPKIRKCGKDRENTVYYVGRLVKPARKRLAFEWEPVS